MYLKQTTENKHLIFLRQKVLQMNILHLQMICSNYYSKSETNSNKLFLFPDLCSAVWKTVTSAAPIIGKIYNL